MWNQWMDEAPVWIWLIAGLIGFGLAAYADEVAAGDQVLAARIARHNLELS